MPGKISVFRSPEGEARYRSVYETALRRWPIPYEELYIPTLFGETHVIASGSKERPPLILLHPAGCGSIIWYRNVGPLSEISRVFAVDTITEINLSRVTQPIKGCQDFADWSVSLFDGLHIDRADIIGNSFGGFVALNTALYHPERVKKVVLISPAATFDPMKTLYRHYMIPVLLNSILGISSLLLQAYDWLWQGFPKDEYISQLRYITAAEGVMRHGPPIVFTNEELRKIRSHVLLLIGDHEVIYKPEDVFKRATEMVPELKAEIIPNANHNAEFTAADFVNKKIIDFLTNA